MKQLFLVGISLLAVSACVPQPSPPPAVSPESGECRLKPLSQQPA